MMENGGLGAGAGKVFPQGSVYLASALAAVFLEVKSAFVRHALFLAGQSGQGKGVFFCCKPLQSEYSPSTL
jgi:hypothetical protein